MGKACVLGIAFVILATVGCKGKGPDETSTTSPLIAKVAIDIPGASPETIDATMFPLFMRLSVIPHFRTFTCISRQGTFEGYVVADADADFNELQDRLYSSLPADKFPSDAGKLTIRFTKDPVPTVTPKNVPCVDVHLDRDKLNVLGITPGYVEAIVDKHPAPLKDGKVDESLENETVAFTDGKPVRLRDVATFKVASKPDCIVRTYPPCPPGATGTPSFGAPVPR